MSSVPQQSFESSLSKSFTAQASGGSGSNVGFRVNPSTLSVKFNSPLAILNPTPLGKIHFALKLINTHSDTLFSAKQHIGFNVPYIDHLEDNKYVLHMGNNSLLFQIKDTKSSIIPDKNWITQDSLTGDISFEYNKLPTFYLA